VIVAENAWTMSTSDYGITISLQRRIQGGIANTGWQLGNKTYNRSYYPLLKMLHNPNNWHWVNKDASGWTKEYLEENIKTIKAEENGVTAQLDKLVSMDGDVDVSQRKGKVITIYDVKLVIEYSGMLTSSAPYVPLLTDQAKPRIMRTSAVQSRSQR